MRTLAIGDIHGCYRSLQALEAFAKFSPDDRLVTLGDYVDRGPDTKSVVEWLIDRHAGGNLIALLGNHELMMLAAYKSDADWQTCIDNGGNKTLASYETSLFSAIPKAHIEFIETQLRPFYETETHIFVHANFYADMSLADQPDYMLYWERLSDPAPHESGKTVICGHSSQRSGKPLDFGHTTCIDTRAHGRTGWLTCMDVGARFCWQANEQGDTRSFWLDEME